MKRRPRNVIFRMLVLLVIGAIINVAVAWWFGARGVPVTLETRSAFGAVPIVRDERGLVFEWWQVGVWQQRGIVYVRSERMKSVGPGINGARGIGFFLNEKDPVDVLPPWAKYRH